ncbi:penicillin-binding protein 1C [Thermophagus sp. OGC60D27]
MAGMERDGSAGSQSRRFFLAIGKYFQHRGLYWGAVLAVFFLFLLIPAPRIASPFSTVVMDREGLLLGARIAADGQWRFPAPEKLPEKYKTALLLFEDEYFYYHPGVNPLSLFRAAVQNFRSGRVVSGGSTITMQVARMARKAPRTLMNKWWEMMGALRLELAESKEEILLMYAANAPFGGNVVGFDAAAWQYFKRPPENLTWAEAACLAVLPNAPGLLRPGYNQSGLKEKRDRLLQKLFEKGYISATELQLSIAEPLPSGTRKLPQNAAHLVDYFFLSNPGSRILTTIDKDLQMRAAEALQRHSASLAANHIRHAAALIAEVETGQVLAYVGNSKPLVSKAGHQVDMIRAERSSGSILKPFLYAASLQDGLILPQSLLPDVPTRFGSYNPENFYPAYDGAVPAGEALSRSLNVPFVRLLKQYGGDKFLKKLSDAGITTLNKGFDHYGLSLILGGGEVTLWDLAGSYASMGRTLNHFTRENSRYRSHDFHPLTLMPVPAHDTAFTAYPPVLSAGAIWWTFKAMESLVRPPEEKGWENFTSQQTIAWKTGTSFGFRDAWSVGLNGRYVVAVWVGNASGEGRPGLLGGTAAAPLMFQLFSLLPHGQWYPTPHDDLKEVPVCRKSGFRAGPNCPDTVIMAIPYTVKDAGICPWHTRVHLTPDRRYRTTIMGEPEGQILSQPWFVLPPVMAWYYSRRHPEYQALPPLKPGCMDEENMPMDFIYPEGGTSLIRPVDLDGDRQNIVLKAVHRDPEALIYWHLDGHYIGSTQANHEIEIAPTVGTHQLTIVDPDGNRLSRNFRVLK